MIRRLKLFKRDLVSFFVYEYLIMNKVFEYFIRWEVVEDFFFKKKRKGEYSWFLNWVVYINRERIRR